MLELEKYRGVMSDGTENWCKIWRKLTCALNFDRLKISDFILDSKMVELNQNKNLKQLGRPDAMSKLYFSLEIKE